MKNYLTLICCVLFSTILFGQAPANDDCADLVDFGVAPACPDDIYTNVDATDSSFGPTDNPTCFNGGTTQRDVFFGFVADPSLTDLTITITGTDQGPNGIPITNPQIALYRGSCAGLAELFCVSAPNGSTSVSLDAQGLTPGIPYFIRINDYSSSAAPNWGDFTVCIEEFIPDINIGTVATSTSCTGTIFDSGGPDADYSNNENLTFTVCPSGFSQCIALDVASFNIPAGDVLNIYAGNDNTGDLIAALTGVSNGNDFVVEVPNACMTLEFISNGFTTGAGFNASWTCSSLACGGSDTDDPTGTITSIPFINNNLTTCGEQANFANAPCDVPFLNGPEAVFVYESPGDICASIEVTDAPMGTGVLVLDGPPGDPGTVCVAQSGNGNIVSANFEDEGTYYIIVANPEGCVDFGLNIAEAPCTLSPALVDALCNPLNGCIDEDDLITTFTFDDGFQDIPNTIGTNNGCWFGVGAEPDYFWFTIEAQADGPFGFILQSADIPSDIDFNVWGPFTNEQVCDTPADVIDFVTNNQPIRSSYAGGTEPTGLADIHPQLGYEVEDVYDCDGNNDDIVQTIAAQTGEVYIILANDWGNQITDGINIDWGPSDPDVLTAISATVSSTDTSVCAGQAVTLAVDTGIEDIDWIGDNVDELSCDDCFDPVATPSETTVYTALLDAVCYTDTLLVTVNVFDLDAGPDLELCLGETIEIPAGQDFATATYEWTPPASGLTFSCTQCPTPMVTADVAGIYVIPVTLTADACSFQDEIVITVLNLPAPDFTLIEDVVICAGDEIELGVDAEPGLVFDWVSNPPSTVSPTANPTVSPTETTTYYVSVTNGLCPLPGLDSVTVEVIPLPVLNVPDLTSSICQGDTVALFTTLVQDDVTYTWTGPSEIITPDSSFTQIVPGASGTYTLTAERGICSVVDQVEAEVIAIAIDLNQPDTTFICQGESVAVAGSLTPVGAEVVWNPADVMGIDPVLSPDTYTVYTATVTIENCVRVDSFAIQVDSLPVDMSIMVDPEQDTYCEGELVFLTSPIYDPVLYPNIEHQWIEIGAETSDTLYNLVLTTQDTFLYERVTVNGSCTETNTIELVVIPVTALTITPADTTVCPGESVVLTANSEMLGELTWEPANSLSCDDCPMPTATPGSSTTYSLSSEIEGCEVTASATITVDDPANFEPIDDRTICPNDGPVALNPGFDAETTYSWTSNPAGFTSTEPNPVVTPAQTTTYIGVATNACGEATEEVTITIIEPSVLTGVGPAMITVCNGEEFTLTADLIGSPNAASLTSTWIYDGESEVGTSATFTANNSGVAVFTHQFGNTAGADCGEIVAEVMINVVEAPTLTDVRADTTICASLQSPLSLFAGTVEPGVAYTWTGSDGTTYNEADPEVMPTETTTYTLSASLGECTTTEEVTITVQQPATFAIDQDNSQNVVTNDNPSLDLIANLVGGSDEDVNWTFINGNIGEGTNITWTPDDTQLDSIPGFVYATFMNQCQTIEDSILIQKLLYEVPNIFSPNGDQANEVFKPFFLGEMDVVEVKVYNRWGQIVFESDDPANPGWDGTKDGKQAPSDTYIYAIRVGLAGEFLDRTGQVTLVR